MCLVSLSCWKTNLLQSILHFCIVDHKKFSKINLYKCLSILPLILYHAPGPKVVMHSQIITNPPPCFTIGWTCWGPIQQHDLPYELNLFIFVSSLKMTRFQSSMVKFSYLWANLKRVKTCLWLIIDFLCSTCAPNPTSLKSTPHNDVKQQYNYFKLKLFCCRKCNFKLTLSNKNDTTLLLSICKKLWMSSSTSLKSRPLHPSSNALQKISSCPLKRQLCE